MKDLAQWLSSIGLAEYSEVFSENDIDLDVLDELTEEDLKELGMSLGQRKRLIKARRKYQIGFEAETTTEDDLPISKETVSPAEKRFLTLMFCDLADSTRLAAALDMEENHALNRAYQEVCTEAIHAHKGYVARYMGDGILAYFGYPSASEDDPERAVHAGLSIIDSIRGLASGFQLPDELSLNVRIGIASGPVVVEAIGEGDARENAVVGEAPNLAARLQGLAAPNSVLLGPHTHRLVEHSFSFIDRGKRTIKGYDEPMATWEVEATRSLDERFQNLSGRHRTSLIGRDEEYNLLRSRWERSAGGSGQVVLLSGEAGIGKTRLVEALLNGISRPHHKIRLFCSPNQTQTPLYPVTSRLQREAELMEDSETVSIKERIARLLTEKYGCPAELLSGIQSLIYVGGDDEDEPPGGDPRQLMSLLQQRLVSTLIAQSRDRPLILVVEDAHWIDASTRGMLDIMVDRIHNHPVMLLVTHRLEEQLPYTSSHVTRLSLASLTSDQTSLLIEEMTKDIGLSGDLIEQIRDKTGGVPLFVEEVTKSLIERESEISGDAPAWSVNAIPDSLHATLLANLDKLGPVKALAQCGAVIGQSFWKDMVAYIRQLPADFIDKELDELVKGHITVRETHGDNDLLRFRHALLRDAAYDSLLKKDRVTLHARVAEYLISTGQSSERANQPQIAHHFEQAGRISEAFRGWLEAGQAALGSGATTEAVELLDKANNLLTLLQVNDVSDDILYRFHMSRGKALNASRGAASAEAHQSFRRAVGIGRAMGEVSKQVDALDYLFGITFNAGRIEASLEFAEEMLAIGSERKDDVAKVSGHQALGMAYCTLGRFEDATHHLESALNYADENIEGINCFPSMTMDYLSYTRFFLGDKITASNLCEQAIRSAHHESQYAAVTALSNSCFTYMLLGDHDMVRRHSAKAISLARESGQHMVSDRALLFHNLAMAWLEPHAHSLDEVVAVTDRLYESRELIDLTYLIGMTAEVQIARQDHDAARLSLSRAFTISDETGEDFYRAELYRLMAMVHLAAEESDCRESAGRLLDKGGAVACRQNAESWKTRIESSRMQWRIA